jgi:hypothetical protein
MSLRIGVEVLDDILTLGFIQVVVPLVNQKSPNVSTSQKASACAVQSAERCVRFKAGMFG